jgi:Fe-S-cluster containining protein
MLHNAPEIPLSKPYPSRRGSPVIDRVNLDIFRRRYFMRCMECSFCHDSCCQYGADIDLENVTWMDARADELEAFLGTPRADWFKPEVTEDADFPGKKIRRTNVVNGACVFLNRSGRGCRIHSFCLERGLDYHDLKPSVCWMFPVTVDAGLLRPALEIRDNELVCLGDGPTLYQSQRDELRYNFGEELVAELDDLERGSMTSRASP